VFPTWKQGYFPLSMSGPECTRKYETSPVLNPFIYTPAVIGSYPQTNLLFYGNELFLDAFESKNYKDELSFAAFEKFH
jgi:hypothetical protein